MTWNGIRGTLQWMLLLLLVGLIAVGGIGLHFWSQKDQLIRRTVSAKLNELFPDWENQFRDVLIVDTSEVVITDLVFRAREDDSVLASIPRLTIGIDGKVLEESRRILVKRIEIDSPRLFAFRDHAGRWNWKDLPRPEPKQRYSPAIIVRNGELRLGLQSLVDGPIHTMTTDGIEVRLNPVAMRRYAITGSAAVDSLGMISVKGFADSNNGAWSIAGRAGEIRIDESLLERTGKFIPEVEIRMAQLRQSPQYQARNERNRQNPLRSVSTTNGERSAIEKLSSNPPESFLRADIDLEFTVGQPAEGEPLDYRVNAVIQHGQVSDLFLPIPLYDIRARIEVSPAKLTIADFYASNNQSSLFVDGSASREREEWARQFVVRATNLQIDERIQSLLPPDLQRLYRMISPSGTFDLDFDIVQSPGQAWSGNLRKFTARNCRIVHDYFRYPVVNVEGAITHQGSRYLLDMKGLAGGQPLHLSGTFGDGTSVHDAEFTVAVNNLAIDDQFIKAFGRKEQSGVKSAITSLQMGGLVDLTAKFMKSDAWGDSFKMQLTADVRDGSVNFVGFPYELESFSGRVHFDSLKENVWRFSGLEGRHGHAHFSGLGSFDVSTSPGQLDLRVNAVRVPIDRDLEKASLVSAPHISPVWTDFALGGTVDVENVNIVWVPGTPTEVRLEGIQWRDGTIKPLALPYQWDDVAGSLAWDGQRLKIHSLHGWHGETYLDINGSDPEWPTFVEVPQSGPVAWEVHFGDLRLVKIHLDEELERALPESLSRMLKATDLEGNVDVQLRVDMRGWVPTPGEIAEDTVTANWKLFATLKENTLFAGLPLQKVSGKVNVADGVWDGQKLRMEGYLELDEAIALNLPLKKIRSPFHLDGARLVVGAPKFLEATPQYLKPNSYSDRQLRAELYTGQIGFDALVILADRPELTQYKAEVNVNDVELAEYASDQFQSAQRLKGKVNGIVGFQGIGDSTNAMTGQGWVNVVPAAIMELPALAQLLAVINFRPVGDTAFNYAYGDFQIRRGLLDFSRIELRGDALGLIGKGMVGFASGDQSLINLTFDSRTNSRVPLLRPIIERLGNSWIRVQVMGTVKEPVAVIQPRIGPLDDAFREFTEAIEKGQNLRPPARIGDSR